MPYRTLALILISVTLSAMAQIAFKLGVSSTGQTARSPVAILLTPGVVMGLAFYSIGMLLWLIVLARVELSQAYPFVGIGFALTTLAGWWVFGDHLSVPRVLGIGLITCGSIFVAKS